MNKAAIVSLLLFFSSVTHIGSKSYPHTSVAFVNHPHTVKHFAPQVRTHQLLRPPHNPAQSRTVVLARRSSPEDAPTYKDFVGIEVVQNKWALKQVQPSKTLLSPIPFSEINERSWLEHYVAVNMQQFAEWMPQSKRSSGKKSKGKFPDQFGEHGIFSYIIVSGAKPGMEDEIRLFKHSMLPFTDLQQKYITRTPEQLSMLTNDEFAKWKSNGLDIKYAGQWIMSDHEIKLWSNMSPVLCTTPSFFEVICNAWKFPLELFYAVVNCQHDQLFDIEAAIPSISVGVLLTMWFICFCFAFVCGCMFKLFVARVNRLGRANGHKFYVQ